MLFNADKCKVVHMRFNNKQAKYDMNDVQLECVSEEKDLGVIITGDLKWEKQCSEAVNKANRMLGMIKRNFVDRSKETIISLLVLLRWQEFATRSVAVFLLTCHRGAGGGAGGRCQR